jgi:hypothetical protein
MAAVIAISPDTASATSRPVPGLTQLLAGVFSGIAQRASGTADVTTFARISPFDAGNKVYDVRF